MKVTRKNSILKRIVKYLKEIPELDKQTSERVIRESFGSTFLSLESHPTKLRRLLLIRRANNYYKKYGKVPKELEAYTLHTIGEVDEEDEPKWCGSSCLLGRD